MTRESAARAARIVAGNNACAHAAPRLSPGVPPVVDANWGLRFSFGYRFFLD
jgi:hypothetical protein